MSLYGCEAPWLITTNNKTCETALDIKTRKSSEIDKISSFFAKLQILDMFDFIPDCLKPCITMDIKLKTLLTGTKSKTENSFVGVWRSKQV